MENILHAYGDSSSSHKSPSADVDYYGDVFSDEADFISKEEQSIGNAKFDKALLKFYMSNKVKQLKRKLASSRVDKFKVQKQEIEEPAAVFTRYSGEYFSSVAKSLTEHQVNVLHKFGVDYFLKFEKTDVPLRFVKWIAGKFDTRTSEIQLPKNFIPVTEETIHRILEVPIGGLDILPNREEGRRFILSHFNLTVIPQVSFFGNKLKSGEVLSDLDIFICFMSVVFQSFLCPNSSLQPSSEYMHLFSDPERFIKYNLSKFYMAGCAFLHVSFSCKTNLMSM